MEATINTPKLTAAIINSVIIKIASLCNLNCTYCYVYNHEDKSYLSRPRFILDETYEKTLERIKIYCQYHNLSVFSIVFHGGEPTLLHLDTFERFVQMAIQRLNGISLSISIQTNATLLNHAWAELFLKYNIGVGISMDGNAAIHDSARVYHSGKGSYSQAVKGIELLQSYRIDPYILCVINPQYSGLTVYNHFLSLGIQSMDFLIPDASHESKPLLYGGFGETPVSDYLLPVFEKWFNDDNPSISIRIFEGLIKKILGGTMDNDSFGNPLMNYLIVETDGNIEIQDALRVCEDKIGKSQLNVLDSNFMELYRESSIVGKMLTSGFPLCETCEACNVVEVCGGGYLPHRFSKSRRFDNPSIWCKDIKILIQSIQSAISIV